MIWLLLLRIKKGGSMRNWAARLLGVGLGLGLAIALTIYLNH